MRLSGDEPKIRLAENCMKKQLSRRKFVAAAGLGALASGPLVALAQSPQILAKSAVKPIVISAANGNRSKDV